MADVAFTMKQYVQTDLEARARRRAPDRVMYGRRGNGAGGARVRAPNVRFGWSALE
jgi:hypothetical protein